MRRPVVITLVVAILLGALGYGGWRAYRYVYERVTPSVARFWSPAPTRPP
ncbi:hypothetical protein G7085_15595 [Tessaracoccus sp. HDW20]|nr:hypothetical protein [Tessaracoccus coleopterorum]NHB85550.1 hypothetical protein [Tessaracoccus coleopterorum]